jgi:hypothetical protein
LLELVAMKRQRGKSPWAKLEQVEDDLCLPFLFDLQPLHSSLQYIQTQSQCQDIVQYIHQNAAQLIGIDTETEPSSGHKTSLLQLAVRFIDQREVIYIFDLLALSQAVPVPVKGEPHEAVAEVDESCSLVSCNEILSLLCGDESVVKIGHGLKQDAEELLASYPSLTGLRRIAHVIETNSLHQKLHPQITALVSLKYLTRQYLHSNLVKAHQCSSWGTRPLSSGQLNYAACDALVLLRLYDAMCFEIEDLFPDSDLSECVTTLNIEPRTTGEEPLTPRSSPKKRQSHRSAIASIADTETTLTTSVLTSGPSQPLSLSSPLSLKDENLNLSNEKKAEPLSGTKGKTAAAAIAPSEGSQKKRKRASKGGTGDSVDRSPRN